MTAPPFASPDQIVRIGEGLRDRTLPKAQWTHAAHVAAAVWILNQPGLVPARDLPPMIRAYNEATGTRNTDTAGYHETITQASLICARALLTAVEPAPLHEACNALLASAMGRPDWLLAYWSRPRLFSVEARHAWTPPDLRPLPF